MSYNYDVEGLDSLVFGTPIEVSLQNEKDVADELDLWSNAQFTFDIKPGAEIYDEEKSKSPTSSQLEHSGLDPVTYDTLANYLDFELPKQHLKSQAPLKRIQPRPLEPASAPLLPVIATRQVLLPKPLYTNSNQNLSPLISTTVSPVVGSKRSLEKTEENGSEEDKRRRNTAASARFRVKKKLREQAMEQSVREMIANSDKLQDRVNSLEAEIKLLRNLLLDKD